VAKARRRDGKETMHVRERYVVVTCIQRKEEEEERRFSPVTEDKENTCVAQQGEREKESERQ
jgi:hypothetical protein